MGKIELDGLRCKGCGLCTTACPGKLLALSDKVNLQGYTVVRVENPDKCTGCALCARLCPDLAILVYKS